ncbi:unnamed protein product, partial [marine sediment metagenome]
NFEDSTTIHYRPKSQLHVLKSKGYGIQMSLADNLEPDDLILMFDNEALASLEKLTVDVLRRDPRMVSDVLRTKSWVEALNEGLRTTQHSFSEALAELQKLGSNIKTSATIYNWSRELVIGPQNLQDIVRIGKLYDDEYIQKQFRKITTSVKKVRRIHSVVRKGLERTLARRYFGYSGKEKTSPVVANMNIYWEDFVERVSAKTTTPR